MNDIPEEFEQDLLALENYRSPHLRQIDPRIVAAMREQAHGQFIITLFAAVVTFVGLLAILP